MILSLNFSDIFKDSFIEKFTNTLSVTTIIITLSYAFLLSIFVYFVYKFTTKNVIYSKKFNISMALMSIITAAVVLSMQSNITVSLGMVGALSIVRFRTAIKEPRDLLFLFWSISNGIIVGSGLFSITLILAIVLGIAMIFFDLFPEKNLPYLLVIYYKNTDISIVENVLRENRIKYIIKSQNISTKGSNCIIELKNIKDKEFIDVIYKIKGIEEVNLLLQDGESQY